jgi:hypothetical protein
MRTPSKFVLLALLVVVSAVLTPSPAAASVGNPVFAGYWSDFVDHWFGYFSKQQGVVLVALGVGAVSLLIITRGKWKK